MAETFAVAWRRVDRLPDAEVALPWLLAVARRVLANQHRGTARRFRLALRLQVQPRSAAVIPDTPALEALSLLPPDDQELLRLLAWEGLPAKPRSGSSSVSVRTRSRSACTVLDAGSRTRWLASAQLT